MSRPPAPPVYFFLLDVSQEAVRSGMLEMTVHVIKDTISKDLLLGGPRTMVFINNNNINIINNNNFIIADLIGFHDVFLGRWES